MTIRMIPLNQLVLSTANVRKTGAKAEIKALAASIAAHGLLQNLQVRAAADNTFEVVAGGRRLAALNLLVKRKALNSRDKIPCHVLDGEDATEISLAENTLRLPMHPADQFEAFRALIEAGKGIEDIAARFGVAAATVRQRLKLAAVSPRLFSLYRGDDMSLDQLMAFTVSEDHAAQEAAWFGQPDYQRSPMKIRRLLTAAHVEANDGRVRFVGIKAYQKAGGGILRDLFQPDHEGYLTDPALLDRLVATKLESEAASVRAEGWKWVRIMPEADCDTMRSYGRAYPERQPLPAGQQEDLDNLTEAYDALIAACGGDPEPEIVDQLDALSGKIDLLSEGETVWMPEILAQTGAIVSIGANGELRIERGLVLPEDKKAFASASEDRGGASNGKPDAKPDSAAPHSAALVEDLTAQRTAALRSLLKDNQAVALAAVCHALALPLFYDASGQAESCLDLRVESRDLQRSAETVGASRAAASVDSCVAVWREQLPPDAPGLFGWLLRQDTATVTGLIALCAALSVNAVRGRQDRPGCARLAHADELADALGLDMAQWWQPTRQAYFGRVPKKLALAAVAEAVSKEAAANLAGLKKEALAHRAEERLAGKGWIPPFLRSRKAASPAPERRAA